MEIKHINQKDFEKEVEKSEKPVMVDFYATWCGPCKMLGPILEDIADAENDVKILKVDIDENPELAQLFNVMSIPTLAAFKDGQLIGTAVGYQPKENVLKLFA